MSGIIKNVFLLGSALVMVIVFWTVYEIGKSNRLIDLARDPKASVLRGVKVANRDFLNSNARFQEVYIDGKGWYYPGVLESESEVKFKEYAYRYQWCGTGFHGLRLDLSKHKHNSHYSLAYNLELIKLLHRKESVYRERD